MPCREASSKDSTLQPTHLDVDPSGAGAPGRHLKPDNRWHASVHGSGRVLKGPQHPRGLWSAQMTPGRRCFLSQLPPRPGLVQNSPDHRGTTLGLKETSLDTLPWMRREALRRRPGRCPAPFLISFQVEKSTQNPLSAQEEIMAPAGQVHPWPRLLWPGATGWRGTA